MTLEEDNIFVNCMSVDVIVHSFPWFTCYILYSGASARAPIAKRYRCEKIWLGRLVSICLVVFKGQGKNGFDILVGTFLKGNFCIYKGFRDVLYILTSA